MKEMLCQWLRPVCECQAVQYLKEDKFVCGIITGIAVYIFLVLLVHLIFIICRRRKKCAALEIAGESGSITVAIRAVAGVLKQELKSFNQLEVNKIAVYQKKDGYIFEIYGSFFPGVSGAPELYAGVTSVVKTGMEKVFGITNIARVNLKIKSCPAPEKEHNEDGFADLM